MARNAVHAGVRLRMFFATTHKAGDLVYCKGFYGVVQDDIKVAGSWGTLILNRAWLLARVPASNIAQGTALFAPATEIATTLPLSAGATTGYNAIGRSIATGNASVVKAVLFHPNSSY
jgi:predicted RecA/RadA family phage recombinase